VDLQALFGPAPEPTLKPAFMRRSGSAADNGGMTLCPRLRTRNGHGLRPPWRQALALALALALAPVAAHADRRDHERARAAVQAGQVMPLPALLDKVQRQVPGQVLEVELEGEGARWVYELKLLQPGGQLVKLHVDAATGEVLDVKRRKPEPPPRASSR
jgi:hypothetical protein